MTCIVGLVHRGTVWMGADSAGVNTDTLSLSVRQDRKIGRNGGFLFGFTDSFRMGQLLLHVLVPPEPESNEDLFAFMVREFVPAARKCMEDGEWGRTHEGTAASGVFLAGFRGRLFLIDSDFNVQESADDFNACGCGGEIARGALFATPTRPPRSRIISALTAAERMSAGVRGPFHIEVLR